jgi:hypothetical protein
MPEIGKAHHRRQRVIQIVGNACNQLPDGRHLLRLDQLVLQAPTLGLVVEQQDHGGSIRAANWHSGNSIGAFIGAQFDLPARSLLVESTLEIGGPLRGYESLPGTADQAGGRGIDQIGKSAVGAANGPAAIDNAQRRRNGVDHFLPGPPSVIMQIDQPGALEGDAGLRYQPLEQDQIRRSEATCLTAHGNGPGYSVLSDKGCNHPAPRRQRRWGKAGVPEQRLQAIVNQ